MLSAVWGPGPHALPSSWVTASLTDKKQCPGQPPRSWMGDPRTPRVLMAGGRARRPGRGSDLSSRHPASQDTRQASPAAFARGGSAGAG